MQWEHQGKSASTWSRAITAIWPPVKPAPSAARWSRTWRPYEHWKSAEFDGRNTATGLRSHTWFHLLRKMTGGTSEPFIVWMRRLLSRTLDDSISLSWVWFRVSTISEYSKFKVQILNLQKQRKEDCNLQHFFHQPIDDFVFFVHALIFLPDLVNQKINARLVHLSDEFKLPL